MLQQISTKGEHGKREYQLGGVGGRSKMRTTIGIAAVLMMARTKIYRINESRLPACD
jgi:hypothetical protein